MGKYRESASKQMTEGIVSEGVVNDKYTDTSFGARGATYIVVGFSKYEIVNSFIYKKIQIGDKVKKEKGSDSLWINGIKYIYTR